MAENSNIEWTDDTFNPWIGCAKVSGGCKHCYAERDMVHRFGRVVWGKNGTRSVTSESNWRRPLSWNRACEATEDLAELKPGATGTMFFNKPYEVAGFHPSIRGTIAATPYGNMFQTDQGDFGMSCFARFEPRRRRVFCASLADVFEDYSSPMLSHDGATLWKCATCKKRFTGPKPGDHEHAPLCSHCRAEGAAPWSMQDAREDLFRLIDATPNLDWLLLTKRPEWIAEFWPGIPEAFRVPLGDVAPTKMRCPECGAIWKDDTDKSHCGCGCAIDAMLPVQERPPTIHRRENVWLGTSVESQATADARIPHLVAAEYLAAGTFLSCEPLLGHVNLDRHLFVGEEGGHEYVGSPRNMIDWVIAGGESGPNARPTHPQWFYELRDQCKSACVPFFFKQWGEWWPLPAGSSVEFYGDTRQCRVGDQAMLRIGKKRAGNRLGDCIHIASPFNKIRRDPTLGAIR